MLWACAVKVRGAKGAMRLHETAPSARLLSNAVVGFVLGERHRITNVINIEWLEALQRDALKSSYPRVNKIGSNC